MPSPAKSAANTQVLYNAVDITQYCDQADLEAVLEQLDATNLASTANESVAGFATWRIRLAGPWTPALDNVFGPDAVAPGTKRNASIKLMNGANSVTYGWTNNAELANYKPTAAAKAVHKWSGELALSGAPTRTAV